VIALWFFLLVSGGFMENEKISPVITEGYLKELSKEMDLIFVGSVLSVGKPPRGWSGYGGSYQTVQYKVEKILKGQLEEPQITIQHIVVYGSNTAQEGDKPGLSPELFSVNAKVIVSSQKTESGTWKSLSEDAGALPATQDWLQKMESALR
jgi:hypothetical protein